MIDSSELNEMAVAYIGATLPTLSETFVSNELVAVRAEGIRVVPVSVFAPRMDGPSVELREIALEALVVYSARGWSAAAAELLGRPLRSARTLGLAARDALAGRGAKPFARAKALAQALAAIGLARRLRVAGVGHIHAHMANTPTTIAMYAAAQLSIGFSFTGHANDLFVHRSFLPDKLRRARFVACISGWHREYYRRFAEVPETRLPVIRCGVETCGIAGQESDNTGAGSPLRVLSVGRLVGKKGMSTLIRAIAELGPEAPVRCEIVGDGPLREELSTLIEDNGLRGRVELLGARPNAEVLDRVKHCDVFVLACQRDPQSGDQDGIPVSLMEAMAAGRCVITSRLEPVTELVIDGETGLCAEEGSSAALADVLGRVIAEPNLRKSLGDAGRRHVVREFDRQTNVRRMLEHFEAAISSNVAERHRSGRPAPHTV